MPRALVAALTCGRCGLAQPDGPTCTRCEADWIRAGVGDTVPAPLSGVVRAARWRAYAAVVIDVLPIAALVAVAVLIGTGSLPHLVAVWVPVVLAVVLAGATLTLVSRVGRSLGGLLLGVRTVDDLTAMPLGRGGLVRRGPGVLAGRGLLTADLRAGHDPVALRLAPIALGRADDPTLATPTATPAPGPGDAPRPSVGIVLETGERYEIHDALLIGRNPVDPAGRGRPILAWPDLSRRLAKTHLLLEWSGTVLWVTDLGSTAGTALASAGGVALPLAPAVRAAAYVGSVIECGGRRIKVVTGG